MSRFLMDLRFAIRSLRGEPGYATAFVLTLGLGIGANVAIFSLVNGVLLRPLPYPESDRIVYLKQPATGRGIENAGFSFTEIQDLREQSESLEQVVEFGDWTFNVLARGHPHRASGGLVTTNFFDVLGMRPMYGRSLLPEDRSRSAEPVAVLTHDYWMRCCDGDPEVIGQPLDLTSKVATIVGVLEPGAHYVGQRGLDFYVNYAANDHYSGAAMQDDRSHRMTDVFARLTPGSTLAQAQAELGEIHARLRDAYPEDYPAGWGMEVELVGWKEELTREARPTLLILLGTAGLVLLIACANVANLSLTRLNRRSQELTIRAALGARRSALRSLLLVESALLSLLGGALGLVLAFAGLDVLVAYVSRFTARTGEIAIDPAVLTFTLLVTAVVSAAFALGPDLASSGRPVGGLLMAGGRATAGSTRRRVQRGLVVGQVALSFTLLVGAGLLARTLLNLYAVDPGFELEQVLRLEAPTFTRISPEDTQRFTNQVIAGVEAQPGVRSAAMANDAPLGGTQAWSLYIQPEGTAESDARASSTPTVYQTVTPGYFATLGVPVVQGRSFRHGDEASPVVVVNEAFVHRFLGESAPIGKRFAFSFGGEFSEMLEVVGVVADTRSTELTSQPPPAMYRPDVGGTSPATVLVRMQAAGLPVAAGVVETIRALDPERPIERVQTLAEIRSESIAPQRLNATLFGVFSLVALAIAAIGLAGVLASSVSQRAREFGIRMALGAAPGRVLGQVLWEGGSLAMIGLVVGGIGAVLLGRALDGLLYGLESLDFVTLALTGLTMLAVAAVASWVPARRAVTVDPVETLRAD